MAEIKKFNIVPDIRLLVDIGQANYQVPEAVSELIANSIDARYEDEKLDIEVSIGSEKVSIVDNGRGMTRDILGEALRLAADMNQVTGNTQARKGMYGLGMKAACSSLGSHWKIVTRPPGDRNEYSVELDLSEWLKKQDRKGWEVEVSTSTYEPQKSLLGARKHGTAIILTQLRDSETFPTAVIDKLSLAYRPHLLDGDKISVNGNPVLAKSYDLIDNRRWEINLDVNGHKISGWYGLDTRTHNDGNYGINIYRNGQLVEAWNKDFLRQHLMSSRVVGEIDLPFIPANFHKLGFNKSVEDWKIVKKAMTAELKLVVRASGEMAKNKSDTLRQAKAIKGLDIALGLASSFTGQLTEPTNQENTRVTTGSNDGEPEESDRESSGIDKQQNLNQIVLEGVRYSLNYQFDVLDDPTIPWDFLYDDKSRDLVAVINKNSRLFQTSTDQEFIAVLALSESVVGFLIRDLGYQYPRAREMRDNWLFDALGSREKAER